MSGETPGSNLTRRGFLALSGGAAAIAGLGGFGLSLAEAGSATLVASTVLTGGYPRMLGFRQSEMQVPLKTYAEWEATFAQFNGIIGKVLQEEKTDTTGPQTVDYFTQFKQHYPKKLVLIHLNGRARRPTFETQGWSAGWWLYRVGSVLTSPVQATDTVIPVAATTNFKLRADAYGGIGDDIVLAPMLNGKPDFAQAEQVRLTNINATDKTLTVVRGKYGTVPRAFPAGTYLAPHVYAGPWSPVDDRVWFHNLSTMCPPDASGRRAVDEIVAQIGSWFGAGGVLAPFDGLELDVFQLKIEQRTSIDANCDGVADMAMQGAVDTYLQGQIQLTTGMRQMVGSGRYLLTDGGVGQEPDTASVNGVELEGFPSLDDYGITLWSQGLMTLQRWRLRGAQTRLSYPLYKFLPPNDYPVSFNRFRLTLASALATNSALSWFNDVGGTTGVVNEVVIWDEMVGGTAKTPGWLGLPQVETIHLAERKPDLLAGAGVSWSSAFVSTFVGTGVKFTVQSATSGNVLLVAKQQASDSLAFTIPNLALNGPDVSFAFDVLGLKRLAYAATIGRKCTVTVEGGGVSLAQTCTVPTAFFHCVLGFHGVGPGPIKVTFKVDGDTTFKLRGLRMFPYPDAIARGFTKGAMLANPSGQDVTFDIAALFPGKSYARIIGSPNQDPVTNNGSAIGTTLTLGPLDALVVRAV